VVSLRAPGSGSAISRGTRRSGVAPP
jgi:hypothetical protein